MNNFILFIIITLVTTPLIAFWAYRRGQSVLEFVALSLLFTPVVPVLILLHSEFMNREDASEELTN